MCCCLGPVFNKLRAWLLVVGLLTLITIPGPTPSAQETSTTGKAGGTSTKAGAVEGALPADWVKTLRWRSIGPATMAGRITALAVHEADLSTYYVATASGGLLKTVNNGTTFEHQFDKETAVSIGDVCVAPSNRDIVWVGTGEANPRNSVSYGDGVCKSVDGGKTWKNMGLKKTFQIGKVLIHPKNPDIVYVGALGRLYGSNPERGVFKTTNGGKTWQKIFYKDDKTGVIDMIMHPQDPDTIIIATWERRRDEFDSFVGEPKPPDGIDDYDPLVRWGPGSGIFKTTDGGKTWDKATKGLPTCDVGRIGLDWYRKDPKTVYAIIDSSKFGMGPPLKDVYVGLRGFERQDGVSLLVTQDSPADKAGIKNGDTLLAVDKKPIDGYDDFLDRINDKDPGDQITLTVKRDNEKRNITVTLTKRPEGQPNVFGGSKTRPYGERLGAQRANVQNRQGPGGFEYGGVYKSTDGGDSWTRINSLNPRPMYFSVIRVDPSDDNYLYVLGVSQYRSMNGGRTFKADGGRGVHADGHALWINPKDGRHMIIGTDGGFYATYDRQEHWDHLNHLALGQFYHVAVDTRKPYRVYGGLQDNASWGGPSHTLSGSGPINEDWIFISGGDGFVCRVDPNDPDLVYSESQNGAMQRRNLRTGERAGIRPADGKGKSRHRFNWNTPFILSHHNSSIFYCAGEMVFKSVKRGDDLRAISPEITRTKRGSATALSESPKNPDVLWVGTDDGALWITRDGGRNWSNVTAKVGLPAPYWVSTIEASRYKEGRCYVCFDAHRSDNDDPHVYVTEDFGETWSSIRANLPTGSSRCLREDLVNEQLLFAGTEFAVWASVNRGASWTKINNNLPTVAVHELALHPTAGEMVAATHGRSLWILDVSALRQIKSDVLAAKVHLFAPQPAVRWRAEPSRGSPFGSGSRKFVGENPPAGAQIYYALAQKAEKVSLKVVDIAGKTVREMPLATDPGLHRVSWNLTRGPAKQGGMGAGGKGGGGKGGKGGFGTGGFGQPVAPGTYRLVLTVDDQEFAQTLRVDPDPVLGPPVGTSEEEDD